MRSAITGSLTKPSQLQSPHWLAMLVQKADPRPTSLNHTLVNPANFGNPSRQFNRFSQENLCSKLISAHWLAMLAQNRNPKSYHTLVNPVNLRIPSGQFNTSLQENPWPKGLFFGGTSRLFHASPNKYSEKNFDIEEIWGSIVPKFRWGGDNPRLLEDTVLICMQHKLWTTYLMIKFLVEHYSLKPENVILAGKGYSTNLEVEQALKDLGCHVIPDQHPLVLGGGSEALHQNASGAVDAALERIKLVRVVRNVCILDDGFELTPRITSDFFNNGINPFVYFIEQTTYGPKNRMFYTLPFPGFNVAESYAKLLEYPYVAEVAIEKLKDLIKNVQLQIGKKPTIGVVGFGRMGQSVAAEMVERGYSVIVYEEKSAKRTSLKGIKHYKSLPVVIAYADVIFGTTGTDITANDEVLDTIVNSRKSTTYVSLSSSDTEFNRLLALIQEKTKKYGQIPDPYKEVLYVNEEGACIRVLGTPVNFLGKKLHSVAPWHIWATRALLMCCIMAGAARPPELVESAKIYMPDPDDQRKIIEAFFNMNPNHPLQASWAPLSEGQKLRRIKKCSSGACIQPEKLASHSQTPFSRGFGG